EAPPVFGRGDAGRLRERFREVALIGEARLHRNDGERRAARDLAPRPLQAQRANVLADGEAVALAEGAGEVRRMDADFGGDAGEADLLAEAPRQDGVRLGE